MKLLKKALISSAVLAGLASTNAFAGTEACFEIYQGEINANVETLYAEAQCYSGTPEARSLSLAGLAAGSVAYELTKGGANGYAIDLGNNVWADDIANDQEGLQIVYIPTTDIPGASRITVKLTNAVFFGNANQIFLLNAAGDVLATSDGVVDGQSEIQFLTQSGTTIPAGTRMVFSRSNNVDAYNADPALSFAGHIPVGIRTQNTTCTDGTSKAKITIQSTVATTDGGSNIIGGKSRAETLVDISPQFVTFIGSATNGEVNAQSTNSEGTDIVARTEFVFVEDSLTLQRTYIIAPFSFVNRGGLLDIAHTLTADDELELMFSTTGATGDSVAFGIYNTQDVDGVLGAQVTLDADDTFGYADEAYALPATAVFNPVADAAEAVPADYAGAASNTHFFTVTQTDDEEVMGFNYSVSTKSKLNFDGSTLLDHCELTINTHNIGINGAVLKVPYTVSGQGNFVRITNEHSQEAEVTVDVFGESVDGTVGNRYVTAVKLANIPAKSSYVYFVPDIITAAQTQKNYTGADGAANTPNTGNPLRHTMTFAVTAPKDTVHGVTVQRLSTGNDRVMPVLDQNNWAQ